ncbi:MAG: hypothetical protein CL811_08960 [Colwelliaceae bacterium]|nr:hypothetical protein [Colwelliaceae bacterium]
MKCKTEGVPVNSGEYDYYALRRAAFQRALMCDKHEVMKPSAEQLHHYYLTNSDTYDKQHLGQTEILFHCELHEKTAQITTPKVWRSLSDYTYF